MTAEEKAGRTPSCANMAATPMGQSNTWYARRTSASVSLAMAISRPAIDQNGSRFTVRKVRGHDRIPVIFGSCRSRRACSASSTPELLVIWPGACAGVPPPSPPGRGPFRMRFCGSDHTRGHWRAHPVRARRRRRGPRSCGRRGLGTDLSHHITPLRPAPARSSASASDHGVVDDRSTTELVCRGQA